MPGISRTSFFHFLKPSPKENDFTSYLFATNQLVLERGFEKELAVTWSEIIAGLEFSITGDRLAFDSQVRADNIQPDMQILDDQSRVYIEIKVEAPATSDQIRKYGEALNDKHSEPNKGVLLITYTGRGLINSSFNFPFIEVSWQKVSDAFLRLHDRLEGDTRFIVGELSHFLNEENMSRQKVGERWNPSTGRAIQEGLETVAAWTDVLVTAAKNLDMKVARNADWDVLFNPDPDGAAYGFSLDGKDYWIGIVLSRGPFFSLLKSSAAMLGYDEFRSMFAAAKRSFPGAMVAEDEAVDVPIQVPEGFYTMSFTEQVDLVQGALETILSVLRQQAPSNHLGSCFEP